MIVAPARSSRPWILSALWLVLVSLVAGAVPGDATPRWGWLGVRIRDLSEQEMDEISNRHGIREGFGAMIVEVLKETPAEVSGLRSGDLVVAFRDRPVVDTRMLQRYIASADVGETVALTLLRRDEGRRRVSVRLAAMPEAVVAERIAVEFGFLVRDPEAQPELGGARSPAVPAVAVIVPNSRAAAAGLKVGDVLLQVNGRGVATIAAVREAMLSVSLEAPLSLVVERRGERLSILVPAPKTP